MKKAILALIPWLALSAAALSQGGSHLGPGDITPYSAQRGWRGPKDLTQRAARGYKSSPRIEILLGVEGRNDGALSALALWNSALGPEEFGAQGLFQRHREPWAMWWMQHRGEQFGNTARGFDDGTLDQEPALLSARQLQELRARALEIAQVAVVSREAGLRRAGAIALARLVPGSATDALAPLLQDLDHGVRRAALLALGSCASSPARALLLEVVRSDAAALERGFALLALGLCRAGTLDAQIDPVLEQALCASATARELRLCALMHQQLARVDYLWPTVRALCSDESEPLDVRARALETLGGSQQGIDTDQLTSMLSAKQLELRRSAALALGLTNEARVADALIAALETEQDPIARGFEVIALGRQHSPNAIAKLLALRDGSASALRPWIALALGLAARAGDPRARSALNLPLARSLDNNEHCATLLAIGMARQDQAFDWLARADSPAAASLLRPFAAEGLGLMATRRAREELLLQIEGPHDGATLAVLGQSLARMRRVDDAGLIESCLQRTVDPGERASVLAALALNGSAAAVGALLETAAGSARAAERGHALQACAAALSAVPLERLDVLGRNANFLLFESWMNEIVDAGI